ncbi:MAG: prepilin-type N-terminal cleavage/methylation domain-containing protein [Candidatus Thiodiazotropha sp.]
MGRGETIRGIHLPLGRSAAGFTLLEVMVAMLLLGVIVTSSVSLLFINIRGWDGLVNDSEEVLQESLINQRLASVLRYLSPRIWRVGGDRRLAFLGMPDRVHFISRAPLQFSAGGVFEYLLVQELDSENRPGLVLYFAPYRPDRSEFTLPDEGERRLLFADTGRITFSYRGSKNRQGKSAWWRQWESETEGYPQAVRIEFAGSGEANAGSMQTIRLMTTASGVGR